MNLWPRNTVFQPESITETLSLFKRNLDHVIKILKGRVLSSQNSSYSQNVFKSSPTDFRALSESGNIDVGDGCLSINALVTIIRCW